MTGSPSLWAVLSACTRRAFRVSLSYRIPFAGEYLAAGAVIVELYFVAKIVPSSEVVGGYFAFATTGLVVVGFLAAAVATLAAAVREEQSQGTFELLIASGIPPRRLAFGLAGFPVVEAAVRSVVYLAIAALLGARFAVGGMAMAAAVLAIGSLSFVGLGLLGAALVIVLRRATTAVAWIVGLAAFASGVVFPVRVLPEWLQTLNRVSPVTLTLDLFRRALLGSLSFSDALPGLLVLSLMAVVALIVGLVSVEGGIRWARKRGTLGQY
jgi:ABC-2 type transport system permease protein